MDNSYLVIKDLGAGDFLAVEAFWTQAERDALRAIFWDAACRPFLEPAIRSCPQYARVEHSDLADLDCDCLPYTLSRWHDIPRRRPLLGSSFLRHPARLDLDLPERFHVVVDSSPKNPPALRVRRDFQGDDWRNTLDQLRARGSVGVVLNSPGECPVPDDPAILDLTGRTSLAESIAVLRRAAGYIGIDSCLSCLAVHALPLDEVLIRTANPFLYDPRAPFLAPLSADQRRHVLCPAIPPPSDRPPAPEWEPRPLTTGMKSVVLKVYQIVEQRVHSPGDVVELPDDRADRLLGLGHAEVFDPGAVQPKPVVRARSPKVGRETRVDLEDR